MATRFIHKGLDLEQSPYSDVAPFAVDQNGNLAINRGSGKEILPVEKTNTLGATVTATTATISMAGTLYVANTTVSVTLTLPLAASCTSATYGLIVGKVTSSGGHQVTANAADTILFSNAAAGSSVQCSAATDVVGDLLVVKSDGATTWHVLNKVGTWAAV